MFQISVPFNLVNEPMSLETLLLLFFRHSDQAKDQVIKRHKLLHYIHRTLPQEKCEYGQKELYMYTLQRSAVLH